jgi:hypothetical protein
MKNINAEPNPEFLIKSIAEQGYSLETAIADLIDNSITANARKIELITMQDQEPFMLCLADDGEGMTELELIKNLQFPSRSPEEIRQKGDLGRFGLGLKTASFSQTRSFTILSRKKGTKEYKSLTWDVAFLKEHGWKIIVNTPQEISELIKLHKIESTNHLSQFDDFEPNTIIFWKGLYKFENYIQVSKKQEAFKNEITQTTCEYLSIVFHRFMETKKNELRIRVNNIQLEPFNPFPIENNSEIRILEPIQKNLSGDIIKIQGFVLPNKAIKESSDKNNIWCSRTKSLMDMEGIYIYRSDRLILYGGWNNIIRKTPKLQLARLRVEIGNKVDHLLHLNVAKSSINIPYDLKMSFYREIVNLQTEAKKEFHNYGLNVLANRQTGQVEKLYTKVASNRGVLLIINNEFKLLKSFKESLTKEQNSILNIILKITTKLINTIRQVDDVEVSSNENNSSDINDLKVAIIELKKLNLSVESIKTQLLQNIGIDLNNMPDEISELLN